MGGCAWVQDEDFGGWETNCGHRFNIESGTPFDNLMKFCCFCGKEIDQMPWTEEEVA